MIRLQIEAAHADEFKQILRGLGLMAGLVDPEGSESLAGTSSFGEVLPEVISEEQLTEARENAAIDDEGKVDPVVESPTPKPKAKGKATEGGAAPVPDTTPEPVPTPAPAQPKVTPTEKPSVDEVREVFQAYSVAFAGKDPNALAKKFSARGVKRISDMKAAELHELLDELRAETAKQAGV
jgi:hypothetical protein